MSEEIVHADIDRRGFLKAAVATAAVASATGTGAALLLKEKDKNIAIPPPSLPESLPPALTARTELVELRALLATTQADNSRLQVRVSALQSQLELARKAAAGNGSAIDEGAMWQAQLEEANSSNANLIEEIGLLRGLVELYEQLDAADVAAVVGGGLAAVGGVLAGLVDEVPSVKEGVQAGKLALDEFEGQLPQLQEGKQWLAGQMESLSRLYKTTELALRNGVKAAGTFLHLLEEWFQDILKWLPFGIGDKAASIMHALSGLLGEIPTTLDGLQANIVNPLDVWLEEEKGETRLQRRIIKPVREQALDRADQTFEQVNVLHSVYEGQLVEPVHAATEQQKNIRSLISQYRQTHNL